MDSRSKKPIPGQLNRFSRTTTPVQYMGHLQGEKGDHRNRGVPDTVVQGQMNAGQSLDSGKKQVKGIFHLHHGGPDHPAGYGAKTNPKGCGRKNQMGRSLKTGGRKDPEPDGQQKDEKGAQHKAGHRDHEAGEGGCRQIHPDPGLRPEMIPMGRASIREMSMAAAASLKESPMWKRSTSRTGLPEIMEYPKLKERVCPSHLP